MHVTYTKPEKQPLSENGILAVGRPLTFSLLKIGISLKLEPKFPSVEKKPLSKITEVGTMKNLGIPLF